MRDATLQPEPFTPRASPEVLADLRTRLRATRWPDAPADAGWSLGTEVGYLRELVAYWADGFDWPAQETALARLPRFRVRIGGLGIHFVHARAAAPGGPVLPLVLCHGWPDSFWRYAKVIPLLTDPGAHGADPADAFDVVVPDMPGYGYSDRPAGPPLDSIAVAGLWAGLMDVTPDAVPVIDEVKRIPGLFVSTGFSGHGFGIGPGAGRLMADLVAGDTPVVDPTPFRLDRFARAR